MVPIPSNGGVHHLEKNFGEKVWIKKGKDGPTMKVEGNFKAQISKFMGPTSDFQMGSASNVVSLEKDIIAKVCEYLRLHDEKPQFTGELTSFMFKVHSNIVFQAGNQAISGSGTMPLDVSHREDQVMDTSDMPQDRGSRWGLGSDASAG